MRHQFALADILTALVRQGVTVVSVLHDLNLAAAACASVVLLHAGQVYAAGTPRAVLTVDAIRAVYEVDIALGENPETGALHIIPLRAARSVWRVTEDPPRMRAVPHLNGTRRRCQ